MAPVDGAIGVKININHPQTTDVNISKAQPSKASGIGGVSGLRSKSAPILYKYRFPSKWPAQHFMYTLPKEAELKCLH